MSVYLSPHERLTYLLYVILINFSHCSPEAAEQTHTKSPLLCQPSDLTQVDKFLTVSPGLPFVLLRHVIFP